MRATNLLRGKDSMRLRFTIRDLLWLAALVAVCVAWWVDHRKIVTEYTPEFREQMLQSQVRSLERARKESETLLRREYLKRRALEASVDPIEQMPIVPPIYEH
jgi:hypothetical protein